MPIGYSVSVEGEPLRDLGMDDERSNERSAISMKITYLIRNDDVKDRFVAEGLSEGVACDTVGTYEAEGGRLFLLSFTVDGFTIAGARKLAELRQELQDDTNTRLLVDDASLKFAKALYPRFAEYERKLRCAITLATCAKHDNFDDDLVKRLEKLPLGKLGKQLFYESNGTTVWLDLFGDEALSSVRENYAPLCKMRNKVMHQRLITEGNYDCARKMLRTSIHELDAYIEKVRSDASYPKRQAARAASAAKLLRDNYESMIQPVAALASFAKELSESFGKLQTPVSALENLRLPKMISELQQVISDGPLPSLANLTSSFPSIDTTAFSQAALANIDTEATDALSIIAALSSPGQMDSSSTDGSDNDLGDVSDDDGKTGSDEK